MTRGHSPPLVTRDGEEEEEEGLPVCSLEGISKGGSRGGGEVKLKDTSGSSGFLETFPPPPPLRRHPPLGH